MTAPAKAAPMRKDVTRETWAEDIMPEEALDAISDAIRGLESWSEGKTLTVMLPIEDGTTKFLKLRFVKFADKPSSADLRGEPE